MDILIAADEPLLKLSLEATLDPGGRKVLGPAATAAALALAQAGRPGLALARLGLRDGGSLARVARPVRGAFFPGRDAGAACARVDRAAAWGLIRGPCGARTVLRAVRITQELREGQGPRNRLRRQIELFHRPKRPAWRKRGNGIPLPSGRRT